MELRHLRYFEVLASELNFSRAAERLHIAQPPLSRQIRQLEDELGVELIDRGSRPLKLTEAGRFFYEQCLQIQARIREAQEATRRLAAGRRVWFGIGFVPSVLYGFFPELVQRFRLEHENVDIGLTELTSIQQAEALKAGRIDVGFGRVPLDDPELSCEIILDEPLVVAFSGRSTHLRRPRLTLRTLAEEPLLLYPARPRPSYADYVLQLFQARGLTPRVAFEANEMQTALGLVAAGMGVTLVPESVQQMHRKDVIFRSVHEKGLTSPVLMNTRRNDASPSLQHLRKLMAATSRVMG